MMMTSESVDDLGLVDGEADGKGPSGDNAADRTDASCTNVNGNDKANAINDVERQHASNGVQWMRRQQWCSAQTAPDRT